VRTRSSSYRIAMGSNDRMGAGLLEILRGVAILTAASAIFISAGFGQANGTPAPPQKPLRERLLDRALKGDAEAQFDLAKGYEGGRFGLPQDFSQARHWYQEAADQREPFAEASLGLFYGSGKGVKRDYVLSYAWLDRSASHLTGPDRDTVIEKRDSIGRRMTQAELKQARDMIAGGKAIPKE
jgi:TPR repeat protein